MSGGSFGRAVSLAFAIASLAISPVKAGGLAAEPPPPRLPPLSQDALTPEQQAAAAEITKTFGAPPGGPFAIFLHRPGIADGADRMYRDIKGPDSWESPSNRLTNLAIMMVARRWRANVEWSSHASYARLNGISPGIITAIRDGKQPRFARADERIVYKVVNELLIDATLSQSTYDEAMTVLGKEPFIKIVTATGFYSMIAMSLVTFDNSMPPQLPYLPLPLH